ncbi:MAG: hypothetical protein DRP47_12005, partial [Candidatus Zixiibacteriota bacterium]
MKSRFLKLLVVLIAITVPFSAFAEGQAEAGGDEKITLGIALDQLNDPFWIGIQRGIEDAGKELGVELVMRTAEGDAVKQNSQINDMIAQGVDGIVSVYADSQSILQAVKACNDAGIPFVYCDRTLSSTADAEVAWGIATDNYALTKQGWEWMADYARTNGEKLYVIELVGALSDENVLRRSDGFKEVLDANSDIITLVQQVPTEWNLEKA